MEFQSTVSLSKDRGFRERDSEQNRLDALRDSYYILDFDYYMYTGGAGKVANATWAPARFETGKDEWIRQTRRKPTLWRNGTSKLHFIWATTSTSVGDINLSVQVAGHQLGKDTLTGRVLYTDSTFNITPGSATAFWLEEYELDLDSADILDEHKEISMYIQRNGVAGDVNPDHLLISSIWVEFLPNNRQ